ncbi:MAG: ATP-binding cassette domain-containing protein [Nitratireductor sp.]|nr:ATP-binding cassette domain-containing protein [Nitratireductor sp.]
MIAINDLTFRIQGRPLLEQAGVTVDAVHKVGLVGRNGSGKTTLFKLITGELQPESGTIRIPKGLRIGGVAQEAPGTQDSLIDTVLRADTERARLLAEAETASDAGRIAEIHMRLADIDAHSAEARAGAILHGLGFDAEAQQRACADFSGGWRMRVALAAVLFSEPDLLLLDEPTNYLDLEGSLWLETYIARYPHTVIIISHDRDLLNKACNGIVHLEHKKLTLYRGNYDRFERTRAERLALQAKMKEKQDARRKHMEAFVNRFRAKASKARQAQSRIKALEKMQEISIAVDESVAPLSFPSPKKEAASPIINMRGASVGYEPGKAILSRLNLRIDADDRIALLGANGNGKSTFAKLISKRLEIQSGEMTRADRLRIAMFAQHQIDDLIPEQSAYDHVRRLMPGEAEGKVRGRVARMGLSSEKMDTKARDLSGGEKARLLLGLITFDAPHLLILDEPTNHLDIDSREQLVMALNAYEGAVILISHDRHLVEASAERLWLVNKGTVGPYDGDMEDYKRLILKGEEAEAKSRKAKEEAIAPAPKAEKRQESAALRQHRGKGQDAARKRVKQLEAIMAKAQEAIGRIDKMLATAATNRELEKIRQLATKKAEAERRLVEVEEEWLELSAELG